MISHEQLITKGRGYYKSKGWSVPKSLPVAEKKIADQLSRRPQNQTRRYSECDPHADGGEDCSVSK